MFPKQRLQQVIQLQKAVDTEIENLLADLSTMELMNLSLVIGQTINSNPLAALINNCVMSQLLSADMRIIEKQIAARERLAASN